MDTNKKLKQYELKILDEFDRICKKYNLKYYLAYGSALGAIRHKGFIPWDDDIDVHMSIQDILKFKEICTKELSKEYYFQDKLTDKYYYNLWAKFGLENTTWMPKDHIVNCKYGICIDIFPITFLNDNKKERRRIEKYTKLMCITSSKYYVLNTKKKKYPIYKKLIHQIIPNSINNCLYYYSLKKLSKNNTDFDTVVFYDVDINKNIYFDKSVFIGNNKLPFEKRMLPVPNDIDMYLKTIYGDYMMPPPKDKRYGHDTGDDIIYDFKNSYKKYVGDKNDKS